MTKQPSDSKRGPARTSDSPFPHILPLPSVEHPRESRGGGERRAENRSDTEFQDVRWVSPRTLLDSILACHPLRERHWHSPTVTLDVPTGHAIQTTPALLHRVLAILVGRALDAAEHAPATSTPAIREVVVTSVAYADGIEIEVADSGSSLPQGNRSLAGGPEGEGMEILATAHGLAARLGGSLFFADCPEGGSAVTLRLPMRRDSLRRAA